MGYRILWPSVGRDGLVDLHQRYNGKITWYRNIGTHPYLIPGCLQLNGEFCNGSDQDLLYGCGRLIAVNIDSGAVLRKEKDCTAVREGRLLRCTDGCAVKCCGRAVISVERCFLQIGTGDGNTDIIEYHGT